MKFLRTYYTKKARKRHWCDRCCRDIEPGDSYEGIVVAIKGNIVVFKTHSDPKCDYPPDPEYYNRENEIVHLNTSFKLAA